jgi:hypothetical protein
MSYCPIHVFINVFKGGSQIEEWSTSQFVSQPFSHFFSLNQLFPNISILSAGVTIEEISRVDASFGIKLSPTLNQSSVFFSCRSKSLAKFS